MPNTPNNDVLPDDPNWHQPIIMGNPYDGQTPKTAMDKNLQDRNESPNSFKYAASTIAHHPEPWLKNAQVSGIDTMQTQPMWFSPLHTPQNWQIASKRREIYQWNRFWYENEPKVAAAIDFYCFTPETQILMADGSQKSISSIQVGEKVRSHTGKANAVIRKFIRHASEDIIKITYSGVTTEKLKTTCGHKILTEKYGEIKYVEAGELKVGDYLLTPCDYESDGEFIGQPADKFAWLAGVYAAEGCGIPYEHTSARGRKVSYYKGIKFAICCEENKFQDAIIDAVKLLYGDCKIKVIDDNNSKKREIRVYGRTIADDLMGVCPGTSSDGTKRLMPYTIRNWNAQELASFVSGFYDGDGCYSDRVGYQGVGVCKRLCEQVANILDRLGVEYSFNKRRPTGLGKQQVYVVLIPRRECSKFRSMSCKLINIDNWREPDGLFQRNIKYFRKNKYI